MVVRIANNFVTLRKRRGGINKKPIKHWASKRCVASKREAGNFSKWGEIGKSTKYATPEEEIIGPRRGICVQANTKSNWPEKRCNVGYSEMRRGCSKVEDARSQGRKGRAEVSGLWIPT